MQRQTKEKVLKAIYAAVYLLIIVIIFKLLYDIYRPIEKAAETTVTVTEAAEPTTTAVTQPQKTVGGSITMSMHTPTTLNPLLNKDRSVDQILKLVFDPLFEIDNDGRPQEKIVQSYSFSDEGTSLTIIIKNDIIFHDGTLLKAEDIEYSVSVLKSTQSFYSACVENIKACSATDDFKLVIELFEYNSLALYDLRFPIIPKHVYSGGNAENIIGSGPYKFVSIDDKKSLKLESFGNTNIESIIVYFLDSEEAEVAAFDSGLLSVADSELMYKVNTRHALQIAKYTSRNYDFISFNFENDTYNLPMRKAIAQLLPMDKIIYEVFSGQAVAASTPVPNFSWLYDADSEIYSYNEKIGESLIKASGWNNADEAGFLYREANILDEDGEITGQEVQYLTIRILVNTESTERLKIAQILKQELQKLGVTVEIDALPYEQYIAKLTEKDFDIYLGGMRLSPNPDLSFMLSTEGKANYGAYSTARMDALLSNVKNSKSDDELAAAYSELQNYISQEVPVISLSFRQSSLFLNERIDGIASPNADFAFDGFENWYAN